MKRYIDADKLKVAIERRRLSNRYINTEGYEAELFEIINSLQQEQPDINLEKEVEKYFQGYWPGMKTPEACNHQMVFTTPAIMRMIEHFYELGLNARKEG